MSDFELNAERPATVFEQAADSALADRLEQAGHSAQVDTPVPTKDTQQLGWLAKILAVPLAPIVIGWDVARAFITKAIPAAAQACWRAVVAPFRAIAKFIGKAARSLITGLDRLGHAVIRGMTSAFRALAAPFRAAWRGVRSALAHVIALADRALVALGRFGSTVAAHVVRIVRSFGHRVMAPLRTLWHGVQSALRYLSTAAAHVWSAAKAFGRAVGRAVAAPFRYMASLARRFAIVIRESFRATLIAIRQFGRAITALGRRILIPIRETLRSFAVFIEKMVRAIGRACMAPLRIARNAIASAIEIASRFGRTLIRVADRAISAASAGLTRLIVTVSRMTQRVAAAIARPFRYLGRAARHVAAVATKLGRSIMTAAIAFATTLTRPIIRLAQMTRTAAATTTRALRDAGRAIRRPLVAAAAGAAQLTRSIASTTRNLAHRVATPIGNSLRSTRVAVRNAGLAIARPVRATKARIGSILDSARASARAVRASARRSVQDLRKALGLGDNADAPQWVEPDPGANDQRALRVAPDSEHRGAFEFPAAQDGADATTPTAGVRLPSTPSLTGRLRAKRAELSLEESEPL